MPDNKSIGSRKRKEQIKFPEVEDIFHTPENVPTAEAESVAEKKSQDAAQSAETPISLPTSEVIPHSQPATVLVFPKNPLLLEIEAIMEENLAEIYKNMPEESKQRFNSEGERTAKEIQNLMQTFKATTRKLIDMIRKWLLIIPGINRFFLEQEAKIKAEKIIAIQLSKFQKK